MNNHNIASAKFREAGDDINVIATMLDGSKQFRRVDDDISGGGMLAFIANGKETINVKYA